MGTNVKQDYFQALSNAIVFCCFLLKKEFMLLEKTKNAGIIQIEKFKKEDRKFLCKSDKKLFRLFPDCRLYCSEF
jgi:hypothetical protein